jgi:hypothetical protein
MPFSEDLHVMAAPREAYAEALRQPAGGSWLAVRRPAVVALVVGTGSAFSATGHVTIGLLVSGFVCWSFVPLLQMATAGAIMRSSRSRVLPFGRRIDLWFMGHMPWSLWILAATLAMGTAPKGWRVEWPIIVSALIPIAWTSVIAASFCRVVLGDTSRVARARTALHQAVTWTIALIYIGYAVALWPRIAAFLGGR